MIYPPKKDMWVFALLMTVSVFLCGGAVLLVVRFFWKHEPFLWVPGVILGSAGGMLVWILAGSVYEITETDLILRLGPLRWRLRLEAIEEVYSTTKLQNDIGWGLALSSDRIRIKCRDRFMPFWISPEDKSGFIAELVRSRPGVKVTED